MRTWIDLSTIETPERIGRRPRDARGYPIPYSVMYGADGKPDFRVIDRLRGEPRPSGRGQERGRRSWP